VSNLEAVTLFRGLFEGACIGEDFVPTPERLPDDAE
jgi:hypothetical protein